MRENSKAAVNRQPGCPLALKPALNTQSPSAALCYAVCHAVSCLWEVCQRQPERHMYPPKKQTGLLQRSPFSHMLVRYLWTDTHMSHTCFNHHLKPLRCAMPLAAVQYSCHTDSSFY